LLPRRAVGVEVKHREALQVQTSHHAPIVRHEAASGIRVPAFIAAHVTSRALPDLGPHLPGAGERIEHHGSSGRDSVEHVLADGDLRRPGAEARVGFEKGSADHPVHASC
jgi:hypothetical protein